MPLTDIDRTLLQRCLARKPHAWEEFVDRFLGLVVHVINHTAQSRSIRLAPHDTEDLVSDVFLTLVNDDFAILRRFRGECCLSAYLTVIARRIVVRSLLNRKVTATLSDLLEGSGRAVDRGPSPEERITNREEVQRMLGSLDGPEAMVVRLYHLEGKTYQEISQSVGMPENSVGPTLSRARAKLRRAEAELTT